MDIWGCTSQSHKCGQMMLGTIIGHRCDAYTQNYNQVAERKLTDARWPLKIDASIAPGISRNAKYARPRNCIHDGVLIDTQSTSDPYIAVSYVWDTNPEVKTWAGRPVTEQALRLATRLSAHTLLQLWIDAICIPQDNEPVKMEELAKMTDIYRGARAVLCIVPEVDQESSVVVERCVAMMDMEKFRALEATGDKEGAYMFASLGESQVLARLYRSRWWTRAWTFQEAILNKTTFLVGGGEETVPIRDVLKVAGPIAKRAATHTKAILGQPSRFWDSILSMIEVAGGEAMPLADAMSSVWRRQCKVPHDMIYSLLGVCRLEKVKPDYRKPLEQVLTELATTANAEGDYSWLLWADLADAGQGLMPFPSTVFASPASNVTAWHSVQLPELPSGRGILDGIPIPHRSTGVVRWQSEPQGIRATMKQLEIRGHSSDEIWNLLFGLQVGLASDIDKATGGSGISRPLLTLVVGYIEGEMTEKFLDMVGEKPFTSGIGFTNYASMAANVWKKTRIVVMCSQGGTIVVKENRRTGLGAARIHKLPVESEDGICLGLVVHDNERYRATAIGTLIQAKHAGSGKWQLTRFA